MTSIVLRPPASLAVLLLSGLLLAGNITGPPIGTTGAPALGGFPAELTCAQGGCHSGNPLNQNGTLSILGLPDQYVPGAAYPITVRLSSAAQTSITRRWGFEITAIRQANGRGAGSFAAPGLRSVSNGGNGRQYITHQLDDVQDGEPGPVEWSFTWTAPPDDEGDVGFYLAGNAANASLTSLGDFIYTSSVVIQSDPVPVERTTWGGLKSGKHLVRAPRGSR